MSFLDRLRKMLAGPPRIQDGADAEADDVKQMAETGGGGGYVPGERYAAAEAAETADEDLETEEAPPDPDP